MYFGEIDPLQVSFLKKYNLSIWTGCKCCCWWLIFQLCTIESSSIRESESVFWFLGGSSVFFSLKHFSKSYRFDMAGHFLQHSDSFNLIGLTFRDNPRWNKLCFTCFFGCQRVGWFAFFSEVGSNFPSIFPTLYIPQVRLSQNYCSLIRDEATLSTLNFLDSIHRRPIKFSRILLFYKTFPFTPNLIIKLQLNLFFTPKALWSI